MAVTSPSSPQILDSNADAGNPPPSAFSDSSSFTLPPAVSTPVPVESPASNPLNSIPNPAPVAPPPPSVHSFAPSFRPLGAPPVLQYSAANNPMAQNPAFLAAMGQPPGIHPPGVSAPSSVMPPGAPQGLIPLIRPGVPYQVAPGQTPAPMPYAQVGNGYMAVHPQVPMAMPPPGGLPFHQCTFFFKLLSLVTALPCVCSVEVLKSLHCSIPSFFFYINCFLEEEALFFSFLLDKGTQNYCPIQEE